MATQKKAAQPKKTDEVKKVLRLPKSPHDYDAMLKKLAENEPTSENSMILKLIKDAFNKSGLTLG